MTSNLQIPKTMRAVVLTDHGDLDKLEYRDDWPTPVPKPGEVLLLVHACGLNNTDINTRTGWYSKSVKGSTTGESLQDSDDDDAGWGGAPLTFPRIQGADAAATVVATGDGVDEALLGERVLVDVWLRDWNDPLNMDKCGYFGSECDGGYAEYVAIDARNIHPIHSELTNEELATFATSYVTAENMLNRAAVAEGDTVLIPGASGGVGSALVQLANRRGATTIGMASESKMRQVAELGAGAVLPRAPSNLKAALREAIGSPTITVVADVVGGAGFPGLINALARGGRYTCAGGIAGPIVELDLRTLYLRDLTFTGATVVPPGTFADLVGYIERGEVKPVLANTYPLTELREAQREFVRKEHIGNIVVRM